MDTALLLSVLEGPCPLHDVLSCLVFFSLHEKGLVPCFWQEHWREGRGEARLILPEVLGVLANTRKNTGRLYGGTQGRGSAQPVCKAKANPQPSG